MYNQKMIALGETRSIIRELFEYGNRLAEKVGRENVFDYTLGNPSVPTPKKVNDTIAEKLATDPQVHGYTSAEGLKSVRERVAAYNRDTHGMATSANHVYMTCGANAGLAIAMRAAITAEQNEIVVFVPYYPEYRVFAETSGGVLVPVAMDESNFQIDFASFEAALSPRTAVVVVNSPNNPSGIVYTKETLQKLADVLERAQQKFGTTILLVSDEPYREIVYNGKFVSPLGFVRNAVLCYSFSKSFSLAGERIGYLAVSDSTDNADKLYAAIMGAGRALGYVCAPSMFQRVVEQCLGTPSDIAQYRENRDLLVPSLQKMGFCPVNPQGAFYVLVKAADGDAAKFADVAKKYGILVVPTDTFGLKGYVRVATCVRTEMITRSLPAWQKFAAEYLGK